MPSYHVVGEIPRKEHTRAEGREGRPFEELMGQVGFAGPSSLLYHRRSPSALLAAVPWSIERPSAEPNAALEPLHLRLGAIEASGDPVLGRHLLATNGDLSLLFVRAEHSSDLYRNAAGDELIYLAEGRAVVESVFGRLPVEAGDYVVIPASTTHRWVTDGAGVLELLVVESTGHVRSPERYLGPGGGFLEGAPYSERDLRRPGEPLLQDGEEVPVLIRHRAGFARHLYATHPFDVVGWDGSVYPYALSIHDFEPLVGRFHQPPPVHQTFAGPGFVVCSFVPRPLDFDPQAEPLPYHHSNVDSDEVLFYVAGDFTSRAGAGIERGSLTIHPAGFIHGPQPGARKSPPATRTVETAVMLDTFSPLLLPPTARRLADPDYLRSWLG